MLTETSITVPNGLNTRNCRYYPQYRWLLYYKIVKTHVTCEIQLPNIACFPSSHWVGASVMKNWDPLESGPELAIEMIPAPRKKLWSIINVTEIICNLLLSTLFL